MKTVLSFGIRLYQKFIRPLLHALCGGPCCRYTPSCSHYFLDALQYHGSLKGSWLGICRLCRCHPWSSFGHDPVPSPLQQANPPKTHLSSEHSEHSQSAPNSLSETSSPSTYPTSYPPSL